MPVIDHSSRPSFVRFERFPRKIKATAAEATAYAAILLGAKDDDVLRYRKFVTV